MRSSLIFILAVITSVFQGQTQTVSYSNVETINADSDKGYSRPRIAVTNNGPVVTWGDKDNHNLYLSQRVSSTWNGPTKLIAQDGIVFASDWAGPEIDGNGDNVMVVYSQRPEQSNTPKALISSDNGNTFGNPVVVNNNNWSRFPTASVNEDGNFYCAVMEFDSGFVDPHYSVSWSTNGGTSFLNAVPAMSMAPGEACDCCPGDLISKDEEILLSFRINDSDIRDAWISLSTDSAKSFSEMDDIDDNNWIYNTCPSSGPASMLLEDSVLSTWMSGASGSSKIYAAVTDKTDFSNYRNFELAPSANNKNYPRIAGSNDTIGIIWQESGNARMSILGVFSSTGISGLESAAVDTIFSEDFTFTSNPDMSYTNGSFHITWQNNSDKSVQYRQRSYGNISSIKNVDSETEIQVFPNPTIDELYIQAPSEFIGENVHIYNSLGILQGSYRIDQNHFFIDVRNLNTGVYVLVVENHIYRSQFVKQ